MHSPTSRSRNVTIALAGAAYVAASVGTAALSGTASVKTWRLAAWLLSLAVFIIHFLVERRRRLPRLNVAARVAIAVAIGAFGVALLGPVRAHWAEPSRLRLVLLSIVAWPAITGIPAFVVALIGGVTLDRLVGADRLSSRARPGER